MNKFFTKHVPVTIGALMATSPLFVSADMDTRIAKLESQMKDAGTQTARGNFGARTALANPNLDGYGFYLSGDVLLWHMMIDDNDYAVTNTGAAGVVGNVKHSDFEWNWGFKVGTGYYAEHDGWNTGFNFTWFNADSHDSESVSTGQIVPLHGNPEGLDAASVAYNYASSHWSSQYYDLNWQIGRNFFVSKYLALNPNLGVRTSWFYNTRKDTATKGSTANFSMTDRCNFWGVGPAVGLDAKMFFGRNFSLYGSTGGSLLWGRFTPHFTSFDNIAATTDDNVRSNFHRVVPAVTLALGLAYDTNFYDDSFNFGIKLGYESQYFFRVVQTLDFAEGSAASDPSVAIVTRNNGDLMMHGFNLNLNFSF